MVNPLVWLVQPLIAPQRNLGESNADLLLSPFLNWRRSVLVLVMLFSVLAGAIDTAAKLVDSPRPSFNIVLKLGPEAEPEQQTLFGDLADLIWVLSFYAMPASALLAVAFWARPRTSQSMLLAGWIVSFLVPVAIALTPWNWWSVELPLPATLEARLTRQYERVAAGVGWGYYYVVVLSPAVLALVPGVMRGCIRVKMLLPEATLPGWLLVAAAPFNGLLVLVAFVAMAQVAPSPLLLAGMLLWLAAPLVYLARARLYTRPLTSADVLQSVRRVQALAWGLVLGSTACLITYAATWEVFGLRLVGLEPKASLFRPWQVVRYFLDLSGRTLFVTVFAADLLLRATLSAWRHDRAFMATRAAEEYDRLIGKLEKAIAR